MGFLLCLALPAAFYLKVNLPIHPPTHLSSPANSFKGNRLDLLHPTQPTHPPTHPPIQIRHRKQHLLNKTSCYIVLVGSGLSILFCTTATVRALYRVGG